MRIWLGSCPASTSGRWLVAAAGAALESGYRGLVAGTDQDRYFVHGGLASQQWSFHVPHPFPVANPKASATIPHN